MLSGGDRAGLAARNEKDIRNKKMVTRREFLDALAVSAAGLAGGATAKSYGQGLGANDRLNFRGIGPYGPRYAPLPGVNADKKASPIAHNLSVGTNSSRTVSTTGY